MRATIRRAVEAHKAQREEDGQAGFSLIELIVVVVILGILAAIAVPIFLNLQKTAQEGAVESIAANAATQVASNIAQSEPANENISKLESTGKVTIAITPATPKIDDFCVTATSTEDNTIIKKSGPGC